MNAPVTPAVALARRRGQVASRFRLRAAVAAPVALYAACLAVYVWAAGLVVFAANEGSAYYVAVARNLATGRGLVVDALWSYATPPLVLPRPAFELWQPLASLIAAGPMAALGPSFAAGQLGGALVGALLAPLAWLVTREAAAALGADARRGAVLAIGSGAVVVLLGPLLVAVALPDSTIPFAVAAVACCWLMARSLNADAAGRTRTWFLLGLALGIAWLARHEAAWLGLVAVASAAAAGVLGRRMLAAALAGGLVVSAPWLVRNILAFGTPLPGQAVDNALLVRNEQIFAYLEPPSLAGFLAQGPPTLLGNVLAAAWHNVVDVLVVPAAPVAVAGLVAAAVLSRRPELRRATLGLLLASGLLILAVATVLFPVASRWGTFAHAAGPLLIGLVVAAVLGVDRAIQAVGRRRGWRNGNAWLAPLALAALLLPLTALQLHGLAAQAAARADHYADLGGAVLAQPEVAGGGRPTVITDHPIWLSDATSLPGIALPAEPLESVIALARNFDAPLVVISDQRGAYPAAFRTDAGRRCFTERPPVGGQPVGTAIFAVAAECAR